MTIRDDVIYLGDNGRAYCGAHLGMTAKATGRDLSGQEIFPITQTVMDQEPSSKHIACEHCGALPTDPETFRRNIVAVTVATPAELAAFVVPAPRRKVRVRRVN